MVMCYFTISLQYLVLKVPTLLEIFLVKDYIRPNSQPKSAVLSPKLNCHKFD
jgi:hypothetical protein